MTVIVVMGVSGSGKTTIGTALAEALGVEYAEADTFHPKANIDKMTAGTPLTDEDRAPWLAAIAGWIREHQASGGVVTSSALKRRYRDVLRGGGDVWFAHLHGDRTILAERMKSRSGHFMPVSLLDSQLADLEPLQDDEPGAIFDIRETPAEITAAALAAFREHA
ncbi:gluconokinase [Amycolatopsis tolypomycina]|uniref:Gluconokinase n=1 Tax=Amycolatopsis tolypomycina TaxID=208445 RepID=A0A1H4IGK0_9PSEU|nr:gluconokinase [Amycolatopsis tolypomycina]SEB32776.1 gluconokinase [Amycolatopsis tolypomycina]